MAQNEMDNGGLFDRAIRLLLKPLARALIARGVTAPAFYAMVKKAYVDAATEDLGASATDSRVTVITGVHRRDVKEMRASGPEYIPAGSRKISILATVVGRWMSDPNFQDAGRPALLPRSADHGPSFEALVQSVSRDIRPRTILDELLRNNIIEMHGTAVKLVVEGLVGAQDATERLHFFGYNLSDHMNAAVDNLLIDPPPHLERAVFYNKLTAASVEIIETEARAIGLDALRRINNLAAERQAGDVGTEEASQRIRFGVFFFKADEDRTAQGPQEDAEP
ncbi:MAG: DUF6502 family protein [Pseudomonadota bacterium]